MLIHSFLTDGLYNWAKLYLSSLKKFEDEKYKVVLDTLGLNNNQVIELYDLYGNLDIINNPYDWEYLSKISRLDVEKLKHMKNIIEHGSDKVEDTFRWKLLMSVEYRYKRSIPKVISMYKDRYRYMLHLDIDMYFIRKLNAIWDIIKSGDIALELREVGNKSKRDMTKIAGGIIGIDMHSEKAMEFLDLWKTFIDSIPPHKKKREYGQTSLFYAWKNIDEDIKIGKLIEEKHMSKFDNYNAIILSGNRGKADEALKRFNNHFNPVKGRKIEPPIKEKEVVLPKKGKNKEKVEIKENIQFAQNITDIEFNDNFTKNKKLYEGRDFYINNRAIHTFITDGFYGWCEFFLKAIKKKNGTDYPIILSSRDISIEDIDKLLGIYDNMCIVNADFVWKNISTYLSVQKDDLLLMKNKVEKNRVTNATFKWKVFISVEQRYRQSIKETIDMFPKISHLMHTDVDMYYRCKLDGIFDFIVNNDINIRFRKDNVCGNLIGINTKNSKCMGFIDKWYKYIDSVNIHSKTKGFGQTSFYNVYTRDNIYRKWGDLALSNLTISRDMNLKSDIWEANVGKKNETLKKYYKDLENGK